MIPLVLWQRFFWSLASDTDAWKHRWHLSQTLQATESSCKHNYLCKLHERDLFFLKIQGRVSRGDLSWLVACAITLPTQVRDNTANKGVGTVHSVCQHLLTGSNHFNTLTPPPPPHYHCHTQEALIKKYPRPMCKWNKCDDLSYNRRACSSTKTAGLDWWQHSHSVACPRRLHCSAYNNSCQQPPNQYTCTSVVALT